MVKGVVEKESGVGVKLTSPLPKSVRLITECRYMTRYLTLKSIGFDINHKI